MTHKEKTQKLREHLHAEEIDKFELLLQSIFTDKSSDAVECLIRALEEDDDYHDEMYQILHAAEAYPLDVYLRGLLASFSDPPADPYWLGMLVLRVMNDPSYFAEMKKMASSLPSGPSRNLKRIAVIAGTQKPEFLARSTELIGELD